MSQLKILKNVLDANDSIAGAIRHELGERRILCLNLISSPGSGKTALLERLIPALAGRMRIGVIEGDVAQSFDAERIARCGAPVVQVNTEETGSDCHLGAEMIRPALAELDLAALDLVAIENVGNLICPTAFDLGEDFKVLVLSLAEGSDKPLKYPLSFREAGAVVLNKLDAAPFLGEDPAAYERSVWAVKPGVPVFRVSARSGEGVAAFADYLEAEWKKKRGQS